MINLKAANDTGLANSKLKEIQEELRTMCAPNTDIYNAVTQQRGFSTIVIPQQRKRR